MASIRLENLRKAFGPVVAVDTLSLEIPDGEFAALLGPSGCGKTTTMNMIAGLEVPTSGSIFFNSQDMTRIPAGKRGVGFVFQNYAIFTHMTVEDNIGFGLKLSGAKPDVIKREVRDIAELLQFTSMLPVNAGRLSINDMQKVALGRSMIMKPGIFLLDEPFSNLDAAFREYMRGELKRIQRRLGQTMIYVTHDQVEAMSMADKIAVMYCGELYQFGSPDEIYNWPVNQFVARFIGSPNMNFINCAYRTENGQALLVQKAGGATAPVDDKRRQLLDAAANADQLVLGIRPEHLTLTAERTADSLWTGSVYAIEPLGPKTIVHLKMGDDLMQAIGPASYRPRVGETQYIGLDLARTHVFDGKTRAVIR